MHVLMHRRRCSEWPRRQSLPGMSMGLNHMRFTSFTDKLLSPNTIGASITESRGTQPETNLCLCARCSAGSGSANRRSCPYEVASIHDVVSSGYHTQRPSAEYLMHADSKQHSECDTQSKHAYGVEVRPLRAPQAWQPAASHRSCVPVRTTYRRCAKRRQCREALTGSGGRSSRQRLCVCCHVCILDS